jgi:hypothetical protein
MLDRIRNLRTSQIELADHLPEVERGWLVNQLLEKRCVVAADCGFRALVVEYDADVWGSADLLEFLTECRVPVGAVQEGAVR